MGKIRIPAKLREMLKRKNTAPIRVRAVLGKSDGTIAGSQENFVWVTDANDDETQVFNDSIPANKYGYGLPVWIERIEGSSLWRISSIRQIYGAAPVAVGIKEHASSHTAYGNDPVWVWSDQFMPWLVAPSGLTLKVYRMSFYNGTAWEDAVTETLDLTSHKPASGARYVLVEVKADGDLVVTDGTVIAGSKFELTIADIPVPTVGRLALCGVRLYAGQTVIAKNGVNKDIYDLRFSRAFGGGAGSGIPGGADTNVQFNDGGVFGGDANFKWDKTGKALFIDTLDLSKYGVAGKGFTSYPQLFFADTFAGFSFALEPTWGYFYLTSLGLLLNTTGGYLLEVLLKTTNLTEAQEIEFPDKSGTLAVTSDIIEKTYWDNNASAGRLWGGIITDAGSGNIDIAAGAGLIKTGGSSIDGNTGIPTSINEGQGSITQLVTWDAIEDFPLAGVGYNLVYWDASEGEFAVQLKENFYANFNFVTDFTIGRVYYDGSTILSRLCGMNRWNFDRRVQMFGEERFPVERASGLMLSETGTRNIAVTAGVIWAELVNRFSTSAFDSSGAGRFTYWRRDGSGGWTSTATQSQINNTQYDDGDGTLGTLTANRYGVHWVYVCHDSGVHVVYGQGDYTLAQAQATTPPASIPGLLGAYASFIGRIIIQKSASAFTEVRSAFTTNLGTSTVTDHGDLSGLQGGTAGEYYHLTSAQATDLTDGGDTTLHTHDLKANLASPALTGDPTAPTASGGDNDTSIATTAFVQAEKTNGWTPGTGTWSYSSADAPTFVISIDADVTGIISVGMRVKLTQTTVKYFIVTAVGAFGSGVTLVTVYGGTDYTLANAAISSPFISSVKIPFGFPASPTKWTVEVTDTTGRSTATPTQNTWYNNAADAISMPIGAWKVTYSCNVYGNGTIATPAAFTTLSTANNSESDPDFTAYVAMTITGNTANIYCYAPMMREKFLTVAAKTTYYLNYKTSVASQTTIGLDNASAKLIIRAVCAYL